VYFSDFENLPINLSMAPNPISIRRRYLRRFQPTLFQMLFPTSHSKKKGIVMKCLSTFFCLALSALACTSAFAGSNVPVISTRPILFVHGFNPFGLGEDCRKDWSVMEDSLTAQGFTGPKTTISYYGDDFNCDVKIDPKGSIMTTIESTSEKLAWYIYNNFSQDDVAIDVVAHSLGGLIVRYALYRVAIGDSAFPPYLLITHAATIASPFTGYSLLAESCHLVVINVECDQMDPLSPFIAGLAASAALVPQGRGGTLWSGIGSNADIFDDSDGLVDSGSATSMEIPATSKAIMPWYKLIFHTEYTTRTEVIQLIAKSLADSASLPAIITQKALPPVTTKADAMVAHTEIFQTMTALTAAQKPAKILPNMVNDEQNGVQFTNVLKGGIFDQMGIVEGDIVSGCTAATINDPFEALDAIQSAGGKGTFQLCILRDGAQLTRTVAIQ
jgi:hypothetical protein